MENENTKHSWEWETDFEQSLWVDIGEEEGVESSVDNENDETAREPKSKIKLVFPSFVSDFMLWMHLGRRVMDALGKLGEHSKI